MPWISRSNRLFVPGRGQRGEKWQWRVWLSSLYVGLGHCGLEIEFILEDKRYVSLTHPPSFSCWCLILRILEVQRCCCFSFISFARFRSSLRSTRPRVFSKPWSIDSSRIALRLTPRPTLIVETLRRKISCLCSISIFTFFSLSLFII